MNKKGSMSIETLVIIILALIALVVIALAFTGGMQGLLKQIFQPTTSEDVRKTECSTLCGLTDKTNFCKPVDITGVGKKSCADLGVSCAGISC